MSCRVFLLNGKRKRWKSTIYYTSDREERWFLVAINHQHVQWEAEWCLKSDIWISVTWHDHINHTVSPGVPWDTYCEGGPETHDGNDGCQVDPASLLSGDVTSCDVLPSYQTTLVYQYIIYTSVLLLLYFCQAPLSHISWWWLFYKFVETVKFIGELVMMDTGILFVLEYFPEIFCPLPGVTRR